MWKLTDKILLDDGRSWTMNQSSILHHPYLSKQFNGLLWMVDKDEVFRHGKTPVHHWHSSRPLLIIGPILIYPTMSGRLIFKKYFAFSDS
jgi:hypothetical protein